MAGRSLRASPEGIPIIRKAIKRDGWKQNELKDELGLETRQPITRLLGGKPIERSTFEELCHLLGLKVEDVAILEAEAISNTYTIDELVRKVRSHCCSKILITCKHIQLYTLKKIDLDQLYVPVFVYQEPSDQRESSEKNPPPSPALETVNLHQHLIIFGKPGAGKSTFSSYLALTCCKDSQADWIPILLRLNDVDTRKPFNLLELLGVAFDTEQTITQQILKSGNVFLLLDGLDEISSQFRQEICSEISNFITCFQANKIIITCRSEVKDYKLPSVFDRVEISEFDETQQNQFIENWFSIANNDSASWLAIQLQQNPDCNSQKIINTLLSNERLRELAKTPILLSLICLVYVSYGVLPKKRSLLYERGLDILLEQWDENRRVENRVKSDTYKTLRSKDKQKILSELARYKFEQTEDVVVLEQAKALEVIAQYLNISDQESLSILEGIAADHGLLFQSARKKWEFSHLTFQEYFVARWFVQHQDWQKLAHNLFNPRWREVFLLTTEMLPSADDLLLLMKQQIDELMAEMAGDEKLQRFWTWLDEKAQSVNIFYKPADFFYKPAAIRAYYFAIYFSRTLSRTIYVSRTPFLDLDLYLALDHNLYLTLHFDQVLLLDRKLDLLLDLLLNLDILLDHKLYFDLDSAIKVAGKIDLELKLKLEMFYSQLPNSKDAWELNKQWWQENGQAWKNQLRAVIIEYRNIGHDWQFSYAQEKRLQQYYYANKLLVDCLNSDCYIISRTMKEDIKKDIEATFLLPINN